MELFVAWAFVRLCIPDDGRDTTGVFAAVEVNSEATVQVLQRRLVLYLRADTESVSHAQNMDEAAQVRASEDLFVSPRRMITVR
jgi:hypothetical protein